MPGGMMSGREQIRQGTTQQSAAPARNVVAVRAVPNSFAEVREAYIASQGTSWQWGKRQRWRNSLDIYAAPVLDRVPVAEVDVATVMRVVDPVWRENPEIASRLRAKIEAVLDYATERGWRSGENPARWRGHLDSLLPAGHRLARVKRQSTLPWRDIGAFMTKLEKQDVTSAQALHFTILTAAPAGAVLAMQFRDVDIQNAVWNLPSERMKVSSVHRIPLTRAALAVLLKAAQPRCFEAADGIVFPGNKAGRPLSDMAMLMLLRRMGRSDLTVQGFRSTFRDWCAETTKYPQEVADAALGYLLPDGTRANHQYGDLMEIRRQLMVDWAVFCDRPRSAKA
jgi:integrase